MDSDQETGKYALNLTDFFPRASFTRIGVQ